MTEAEQFFYDNAGFSYPTNASEAEIEAARVQNAKQLAAAERRIEQGPYFVDVVADSGNVDLYSVHGSTESTLIGSIGGVATESETDPYIRVVAAELAAEHISEDGEIIRHARGGKYTAWADGFGIWHVRVKDSTGIIAARGALQDELQARENDVAREVWANPVRVPELDTPGTLVYREGKPNS